MAIERNFCDKIWNGIIQAILEGRKSLALWGLNQTSIELLRRIEAHGLTQFISAVIEPDLKFQGTKVQNFNIIPPSSLQERDVDALVITSDAAKEEAIMSFAAIDTRMPKIVMAGTAHLHFHDPMYDSILASSFVSSRAFGYKNMLVHIYQCLVHISKNKIKGSLAEFGVYKGGTTVFMARVLKELGIDAKIYAFDTFGGFPSRRSILDMYDDPHDEFLDFESVSNYCKPYNIELVKGDIAETYRSIEGTPLAFSFFDTDNYSPTKSALEMCYNQTSAGGILAFDHYCCDERWLYTLGERIAIKEFFADKNALNLDGTGIFVKT